MGTWSVSLNESYHKEQQYTGFRGFLKYLASYELEIPPRDPCNTVTMPLSLSGLIQQMTNCCYFSQKTGFDISCKLSPFHCNLHEMSNLLVETICMKYQNLFSGKNKIFQNIC